MTLRLGELTDGGELMNLKPNRVEGVIRLLGLDTPVRVELTGNFDPDLEGMRIRFARREQTPIDPDDADLIDHVHPHQIGPTAMMTAHRRVRTFSCSIKEFLHRARMGEAPPTEWKRCLTLEWFSQNGRVLIEMADPILEMAVESENGGEPTWIPVPEPDWEALEKAQAEEAARHYSSEDFDTPFDNDSESAPWNSRSAPSDAVSDLDAYLESQYREANQAAGLEEFMGGAMEEPPGFVTEIRVSESELNQPGENALHWILRDLGPAFDPEELTPDEAESLLKTFLGHLALYGVALEMCDHYTPQAAVTLLIQNLAIQDRITAATLLSGPVWKYRTSEHCPACAAQEK